MTIKDWYKTHPMTNEEAKARAAQLWGPESYAWYDSRQIDCYMVGCRQKPSGAGLTWEEAFTAAINNDPANNTTERAAKITLENQP